MAANYVTITELEFDALLKAEKGWTKDTNGNEYVYSWVPKKNQDTMIKVYSSITPNGVGRKCGGDAIRVCAINTKTNRGIIKAKRVNRTPGWDDRVKERVLETLESIW